MKGKIIFFIPITGIFLSLFSSYCLGYDLIALWEVQRPQLTDTIYTTYLNDVQLTVDYNGGVVHGVAAWLPCSRDTVSGPNGETPYTGQTLNGKSYQDYFGNPPNTVPSHGYNTDQMNFTCAQPAGSLPLYRLYKGPPQTDFIFTASKAEALNLEAVGYVFDRVEGYVFTSAVPGSTPLHRLSIGANIPNHDMDHRYTISTNARQSLINAGWADEGIVGYVFSSYANTTVNATGYTATLNGYAITPTSTVPVPITNVVPPVAQYPLDGGNYASNTTVRPAGAVWQRISFVLYTGDIFGNSNFNHIPIYLHYASAATKTDLAYLPPYDGVALVIATSGIPFTKGNCAPAGANGQLYLELSNGRSVGTAQAGGVAPDLLCDPRLSSPLENNTYYNISFQLDDSANVKLSVGKWYPQFIEYIPQVFSQSGTTTFTESLLSYYSCPHNPAFGNLSPNQSYCTNPATSDNFPVNNTGYVVHALFGSSADTTAQISQVAVNWLDSTGAVIQH